MDQSQVGAGYSLRSGDLLVANIDGTDSQRVDVEEVAGVCRRPRAPDRLPLTAALRLEGHDDEHRVLVDVGGRDRPLEEQRSAPVVDLVVDVADQRLLADHPLGVLFRPGLDDYVVGARAHVRR